MKLPIYFSVILLTGLTSALAANYSSPTFNNLTVNGISIFNGQQNFSIQTVSEGGGTVAWNLNTQQVGKLTLTTHTPYTMSAPSNIVAGGTYILYISQGTTGGQIINTWNAVFKFPGGVKPTLSSAINAVDELVCGSPDGTNLFCTFLNSFQ